MNDIKQTKHLPADLIFTPGMGLVRLFQTAPGESRTYAGHVAGFGTPVEVVEALWRVTATHWSEWRQKSPEFEVWRHTGLTIDQRLDIADRALWYKNHSVHYGWWKIGLHLGDFGLAWARWLVTAGAWKGEAYALRRMMFLDEFPICNWVWARAYQEAIGYRFGVRAAWTTPDTMHDHVRLHSREAAKLLTPTRQPALPHPANNIVEMAQTVEGPWEMTEEKKAA